MNYYNKMNYFKLKSWAIHLMGKGHQMEHKNGLLPAM